MKHVIIGTAGHVDHGKTLLVKALTGIDTDSLIEEKKRGITIELGFAHIDFPDGSRAGIVDVPGHEKFIKNMLAGAGGIDLAMLVVAADEGFMPQTIEHLGILSLLGIQEGLIVITKCDMVDEEWLELMREDICSQIEGTFLEGKPILPVSAYTGQGIPELREALHLLVVEAKQKNLRIPFRLPIDRVFSVDGFGTVVTGTLIEGYVNEGDAAQLMPSGTETRIRNIQVHGADVHTAYAGQRVAINLAGIKKTDIQRGDAVVKYNSIPASRMIDVRLQNLKNSKRIIATGSQVHLYHGSNVQQAKIVLLDRDKLQPGDSCYAQLRLVEPLSAKIGDRFVIRFFSPLETIGGGVVLDNTPYKHKCGDQAVLESLRIRESGSSDQILIQTISKAGYQLISSEELAEVTHTELAQMQQHISELTGRGSVIEIFPDRFLAADILDAVWDQCKQILGKYHEINPLHAGMKQAELRQKLFPKTPLAIADGIIGALEHENRIRNVADRYSLPAFSVQLTKRQAAIREKLLNLYEEADINVPNVEDILLGFQPKEKEDCHRVLESLISGGELVMLSPQLVIHSSVYERILSVTKAWFAKHETLSLSEFRDLLDTSRKYALAMLEYYDRNKLTKKEGDVRKATTNLNAE